MSEGLTEDVIKNAALIVIYFDEDWPILCRFH